MTRDRLFYSMLVTACGIYFCIFFCMTLWRMVAVWKNKEGCTRVERCWLLFFFFIYSRKTKMVARGPRLSDMFTRLNVEEDSKSRTELRSRSRWALSRFVSQFVRDTWRVVLLVVLSICPKLEKFSTMPVGNPWTYNWNNTVRSRVECSLNTMR